MWLKTENMFNLAALKTCKMDTLVKKRTPSGSTGQKKTEPVFFDFEKEWERGLTIDEARQRSANFIKSLPWKK